MTPDEQACLDAITEKYVKPAIEELARKVLAGEPFDELEQRILAAIYQIPRLKSRP